MNKGTSVFKRRALPAEQVAAAVEAASGSPLTGDPLLQQPQCKEGTHRTRWAMCTKCHWN